MLNKDITQGGWWEKIKGFARAHIGLTVIIVAALLLQLTTAVMYYTAENIIQHTMEQLVEREMNAVYMSIRNKLAQVESTVDNMAWVVGDDLEDPDNLFVLTRQLVSNNPDILGSSISCIPYLYPQKGRLFEPYAVCRKEGGIESLQLASERHDYTQSEFFTTPIALGKGHWSEPYDDSDGAKERVTTYGVPVRDSQGKIVAVADADISLHWLNGLINEGKAYRSTRRFLVTGSNKLLAGNDNATFRMALKALKADDDQKGYVTLQNKEGEKLHVFFSPIGGKTKWVLLNVVNDSDVFGALRSARLHLQLLVVTILLLLGFIIWRTLHNLERLRKVNAEKNRIAGELRVASQIQQSMLPKEDVRGEGSEKLEVRGFLKPAREVGGDLYDYFVRDEKLFFCIGDVSGKGAPSALLMAVAHALFRSAAAHESNPASIMQTINETACQGNDSNMFVTMFIGVLDLPTGHLSYCDAGHDAPVILSEKGIVNSEKLATALEVQPNLPVGVFDDYTYSLQETQIAPGSTIFLYTDGLTEAMNSAHKQFGLDRVKTVLASCADKQPQEILETVTDAVHGFVKDAEQSDDLTMLAIKLRVKN